MTTERHLTIAEAAARIGCSPYTLRDWCTRLTVPHHRRFGARGIYFTEADLAEILRGQSRPVRPPAPRAEQTERATAPAELAEPAAINARASDTRTAARPGPGRYGSHLPRRS